MKKSEKALKKNTEASADIAPLLSTSTDILNEIRELKKAQLIGNRHLKTLKIFGWIFVSAAVVGLVFFIKFTIALTGFLDNLSVFMDNLSATFTGILENLAAFNGFIENLTVILNDFADNLAAFNEFIATLSGWF